MASKLASAHLHYLQQPDELTLNRLLAEVTSYSLTLCAQRRIDLTDAEEIAQETALSVHIKLEQYNPARSSFRTWVHRLTLDQVCIHRRKGEAHTRNTTPQPEPTYMSSTSIDPALIRQIRLAAGDNAKLIDLILATGDVSAAARHLGITQLAAQRRLKRIGAKINLAERSKTTCEMP
jgi:DNA-directed RNA polymerase specialized sigma24 family protein